MCETTTTTKTTHFVYLAQSVQQQRKQRQQLITLFSWLISASCSLVLPLLARLAFSVSEHSFSSPLPSTGETLPSTGKTLPPSKEEPSKGICGYNWNFGPNECHVCTTMVFKAISWSKILTFFADVFGRCTAALINPFGQ